jgi:hypothetical protein
MGGQYRLYQLDTLRLRNLLLPHPQACHSSQHELRFRTLRFLPPHSALSANELADRMQVITVGVMFLSLCASFVCDSLIFFTYTCLAIQGVVLPSRAQAL